jgi:hypothetical protein
MENLVKGLSGAGGDGRDDSVASFLAGRDGLDEPGSQRGGMAQVSSSSLSCCQHPQSGVPLQGSGGSSCKDQATHCQYPESCFAKSCTACKHPEILIEACACAFVFLYIPESCSTSYPTVTGYRFVLNLVQLLVIHQP